MPLKKGDKVTVRLADVPNPSPAIDATIPFREIKLWSADYFAGLAEGSRSRFTGASGRSWLVHLRADRRLVPLLPWAGVLLTGSKAPYLRQETVNRINEFRNNLTVYRGPVEFITQERFREGGTDGHRSAGHQVTGGDREAESPTRGTVNSPLGTFRSPV